MVNLRVLPCGEGYFLAEPARKFWGLRKEVYVKTKCQKAIIMLFLDGINKFELFLGRWRHLQFIDVH